MRITHSRTTVLAALAAALTGAPAQAAEVIVVDGARAVRRVDPFVPSRAGSDLGRPLGSMRRIAGASRSRGPSNPWHPTTGRASRVRRPSRGARAITRVLRRALRRRAIERRDYVRWRRGQRHARLTLSRLRGARRAQLEYVMASVERLALTGQLIPSRMPVAFLQLARNRQYWRALPYPATGDRVSFRGSELLFQYFPGRGLQLHPLATFKRANLIHGACERGEAGCDPDALRTLLDEMAGLSVRRGRRFVAWEYLFDFGGGSPPWMSGMAQATGIQALARAAELLAEPRYIDVARSALAAFKTPPPTGVRTGGPLGGVHFLQYSFAPRLYIFNAFLQSLIGLHDFAELAGDQEALALYEAAEPEARKEVPLSDVGDWSRYSYRGAESTREYHELLRELLQSMCIRRLGELYCTYARRYRGYQTEPPVLTLDGPAMVIEDEPTSIRFTVSKLSAVELKVYRGARLVHERLETFRRGPGSFSWLPRSPGRYRLQLAAKELRTGAGLRGRDSGTIEVE
jgi:D-glucuronyl C5-epimerase C-terminus